MTPRENTQKYTTDYSIENLIFDMNVIIIANELGNQMYDYAFYLAKKRAN
jgi:hypothetical protein